MIRIVFIIRRFVHGGAERQLVELLRHLDKTRFAVKVICLYRGGELWDEAIAVPNISVEELGKTARWNFGVIIRLLSKLHGFRPQIVHGYMDLANLLALAAKPVGAKVVWGIRATTLDISRYDCLRRFVYRLESLLARFCDGIICNSEAALKQLPARGFPTARAYVVPNGIDTSRFSWNPVAGAQIRAEWGIARHEFLIGLIGRLDPMKGHEVFLNAASMLKERGSGFRFVLVGDGPASFRSRLEVLSRELGLQDAALWVGARKDIPAIICALDLSVSASVFGEGFSNSIAESLACGVPCVATDVGDAAKIMCGDKWLAQPGDAVDLARKMGEARDRRTPDDEEARCLATHVQCNYGLARLAQSTQEVLWAILRDNGQAENA